jgi:4-diphosphocytidyl-2-C-methyl-D-erythritol kinase
VPFLLQGGTGLGLDRGDELYPLDDVTRAAVVVIKPSFDVVTADAYRWLDEDRQNAGDAGAERLGSGGRRSLQTLDVGWPSGPLAMSNDLQEPVAHRHPMIVEMIEACRREGASAAAMSGSGSAVFGIFAEGAARRAARRLQRPDWLVVLTRTLTRREAARRLGL